MPGRPRSLPLPHSEGDMQSWWKRRVRGEHGAQLSRGTFSPLRGTLSSSSRGCSPMGSRKEAPAPSPVALEAQTLSEVKATHSRLDLRVVVTLGMGLLNCSPSQSLA